MVRTRELRVLPLLRFRHPSFANVAACEVAFD